VLEPSTLPSYADYAARMRYRLSPAVWRGNDSGCHCGQVRFECTTDMAMVTACNCSICTKKGLHFTFLPPSSFQLRAGEENLREYLFNKHAIHHQLCIDCGVDVFARGKKPDGTEVVAINVSCIDGIDLSKITMTPIDGRNS
jgi:hypothetical protein